ncbi:histidine kinase [Rhizobium sp. BE258]|jgi:hypothetical protein|uniref:histidine kinase n=1 Tax=unclassified Rhizobium TaxID=2613769 RepID=UPI000DD8629D|nr:histidine kinase [Rhizobium sp. BE258]MDR7142932.1 hypothetical protein [Rhizobium sp. BE258]
MKILLAGVVLAALLPGISQAKTLEFPSDAPIAEIAIPDAWNPEETDTGIQATSADSAIYLSIDIADEKTTDKVIDDAVAFLEKNGVKIDGSTQKKSDEQINGMDMTNFDWTGKDDDGAVNVGLSLLSPKAGKLLVITYWGSQGTQEAHASELQGIISSLKAAE